MDDLDVQVLLLLIIDSQPEMQAECCQGWVLDNGVVVECGKRFPVGTSPSKRRDHFLKCAARTDQWASEEGFRLGMRVESQVEPRAAGRKLRLDKGLFRSERQAYSNAGMRCTNSKNRSFCHYGGRGIEFRFVSFEEFINHIGAKPSPDLTLDRINNDGHYAIGNVKWATHQEQSLNRRRKYVARWSKVKKEKV